MMLSQTEKERYSRHLIIDGFGEENQEMLRAGRVLVIGAGGLGCPVIQYLVAAGIGKIGIVDGDVVSLSNLQRQILFAEDEIGQSKAEIAATKMSKLNGMVDIHIYNRYLTADFANELFPKYDVVVGCTDNYGSRYIIDSVSRECGIPFVHGSVYEFEGQLGVFNYKGSTSYAEMFGEDLAESKEPVGVVGALPGIIGSLMAMEVLKIISGMGAVHADRYLLYNALDSSFRQFSI